MSQVAIFAFVVFLLLCQTQQRPQNSLQSHTYFLKQLHSFQQKNNKNLLNQRKLLQLAPLKQNKTSYTNLKEQILEEYFSTEKLEQWSEDFLQRCGIIARKFSIGKSVENRDLWVLEISNNPGKIEAKPNLKYIGNIHGNEPSGRQLLPQFAEFLCENYKEKGSDAEKIVSQMHLFLLPCMNPDGFESNQRENINGVDLNRNFPDQYNNSLEFWSGEILDFEQPETQAIHEWALSMHFVSSLQFHEGALVVNYPFDGRPDLKEISSYEIAPDDVTFRFLSKQYAQRNFLIADDPRFVDGITNGAFWYPVYGGMQDWNYLMAKCFELTLEISGIKTLNPEFQSQLGSILAYLWAVNRDAMINYALSTGFGGVRGFVFNELGGPIPGAIISVEGVDWDLPVYSHFGDFSRPLAPGIYEITASSIGYKNSTTSVKVPKDGSGAKIEFVLERQNVDPTMKMSRP